MHPQRLKKVGRTVGSSISIPCAVKVLCSVRHPVQSLCVSHVSQARINLSSPTANAVQH
jgi:hypothetical protein